MPTPRVGERISYLASAVRIDTHYARSARCSTNMFRWRDEVIRSVQTIAGAFYDGNYLRDGMTAATHESRLNALSG